MIFFLLCGFSVFCCICGLYTPEASNDMVTFLPKLDLKSQIFLSGHYSGYFQISKTKYIQYYFVESEGDIKKDPLFVWTNGGPGCSGFIGMFTENGPWRPIADDTGNLILTRNPNTWSRLASVLFIEQPAGVGFSYTNRTETLDKDKYTDDIAAKDSLKILLKFFERFPERLCRVLSLLLCNTYLVRTQYYPYAHTHPPLIPP